MNAQDLLAKRKRRTESVALPEVGASVFVRGLTTPEVTALRDILEPLEDSTELAVHQVRAFLCDEQGEPLFDEAQAREFVISSSWQSVHRIVKAGSMLNSLNDEAVETARGN